MDGVENDLERGVGDLLSDKGWPIEQADVVRSAAVCFLISLNLNGDCPLGVTQAVPGVANDLLGAIGVGWSFVLFVRVAGVG